MFAMLVSMFWKIELIFWLEISIVVILHFLVLFQPRSIENGVVLAEIRDEIAGALFEFALFLCELLQKSAILFDSLE